MLKQLKNYEHILSLDPSGSFNEGKGHTGWVIINNRNEVLDFGTICATDYRTVQDYWNAHEQLILNFNKRYRSVIVVFEDYLLYAHKTQDQINSRMETPQLLGILKYLLDKNNIAYTIQTASEVKRRWTEDILTWKNLLLKKGEYYYIRCHNDYVKTNRHIRDAYKHAIHFNTFKNKEL